MDNLNVGSVPPAAGDFDSRNLPVLNNIRF